MERPTVERHGFRRFLHVSGKTNPHASRCASAGALIWKRLVFREGDEPLRKRGRAAEALRLSYERASNLMAPMEPGMNASALKTLPQGAAALDRMRRKQGGRVRAGSRAP